MQSISNIAGYKFIPLTNIAERRSALFALCRELGLKGTILISHEGINISLAGDASKIKAFLTHLNTDADLAHIRFHQTYSATLPFKRLKVKIKKEIITFRRSEVDANHERAPSVSPQQLKEWLNAQRDITLLDTRNDYEVRFGTFKNAINLHIDDFGELPDAVSTLEKEKPIVMFCTGGIRCEKAAIHMQQVGFKEVYQLDTGILGYFAQVGGEHYDGECFVFDDRIALDPNLQETGTIQCTTCYGPVKQSEQSHSAFKPGVACPNCATA